MGGDAAGVRRSYWDARIIIAPWFGSNSKEYGLLEGSLPLWFRSLMEMEERWQENISTPGMKATRGSMD